MEFPKHGYCLSHDIWNHLILRQNHLRVHLPGGSDYTEHGTEATKAGAMQAGPGRLAPSSVLLLFHHAMRLARGCKLVYTLTSSKELQKLLMSVLYPQIYYFFHLGV